MSTIDEQMVVAHFIVSNDVERSRRFYTDVLGGKTVISGESGDSVTYVALANTWVIINVGGGPTDDKPTVTLETPPDPDRVSSFLNIRVADIQAVYEEWSARGADSSPLPRHTRPRSAATCGISTATSSRWARRLCRGAAPPVLITAERVPVPGSAAGAGRGQASPVRTSYLSPNFTVWVKVMTAPSSSSSRESVRYSAIRNCSPTVAPASNRLFLTLTSAMPAHCAVTSPSTSTFGLS